MHSLDDMIEKYRHELLEFSKQNPARDEIYREAAAAAARPAEDNCRDCESGINAPAEKERQYESSIEDEITVRPYTDNIDFEMRNGSRGTLRVQVFAADRSFPVSGARVTVEVPFLTGGRELFSGATDADGIADNIVLPAPDKSLSLDEDNTEEPFALYRIRVTHPDYAAAEYENIAVFDSVRSIQPVKLVPLTQSGNEPSETVFGGV